MLLYLYEGKSQNIDWAIQLGGVHKLIKLTTANRCKLTTDFAGEELGLKFIGFC